MGDCVFVNDLVDERLADAVLVSETEGVEEDEGVLERDCVFVRDCELDCELLLLGVLDLLSDLVAVLVLEAPLVGE